jgi:hypothetical protein
VFIVVENVHGWIMDWMTVACEISIAAGGCRVTARVTLARWRAAADDGRRRASPKRAVRPGRLDLENDQATAASMTRMVVGAGSPVRRAHCAPLQTAPRRYPVTHRADDSEEVVIRTLLRYLLVW